MPERIAAENYHLFVGMDVSAETVDAAWGVHKDEVGSAQTFEQSPAGYQQLVAAVAASGVAPAQVRVVMEATGTYWMRPAVALWEAGMSVCVLNPRQVHDYRKSEMQYAKTDALDARLLARLGGEKTLPVWEPTLDFAEALLQRLTERDQLVEQRQRIRNAQHALKRRPLPDPAVLARQNEQLALIAQHIQAIDRELKELLKVSPWWTQARRLMTIRGIGLLGASWLLVITRGFTTCERADQLTSYLGLVPYPSESGRRKGHKPLGNLGHARARRVLYQCAVSAACHNPAIRIFYQRLRNNGKPTKVARCAAARKLVCQAFAVVTKEIDFDATYHLSQPVQALVA
jgi:transposase